MNNSLARTKYNVSLRGQKLLANMLKCNRVVCELKPHKTLVTEITGKVYYRTKNIKHYSMADMKRALNLYIRGHMEGTRHDKVQLVRDAREILVLFNAPR